MTDQNSLAVEGDYDRTPAQYREVGIIPHAHLKIRNALVRDEGRLVREHVVGGTSVGDGHPRSGIRRDGRSSQTTDNGLKLVWEDETG